MPEPDKTEKVHRPVNKANMQQPQEEFIQPEGSHADHDRGHGHEVEQSRVDESADGETTD